MIFFFNLRHLLKLTIVICIEQDAFYSLVEKIVEQLKEEKAPRTDKWISVDEAMELLHIKSKTTLQKLRDEGKIRGSHLGTRIVLYDRDSIIDYLEDFAYETF